MHVSRFRRLTATAATLTAAAVVAAGCGDESGSSNAKDTRSPSAAATSGDDGSDHSEAATGTDPAISSPGVDLRMTLDRLLAEHAALAYVGLTKTIAGEADAKASVAALSANTDDLTAAITSVYGEDAGASFRAQWEAHIGMFVQYATGVATKDQAMQAKAQKNLAGYQKNFARFLNDAAGLEVKAAEAALGMHVKQLLTAMDQYAAGDYAAAYASAREAYAHMYGTGDALSAAVSRQKPDEFGTGSVTPAVADTRVLVNQQLGEHASLAAVATTESLQGTKDASAAVAALDANSVALSKTIGSVYGPEAEQAFLTQWRAHIGLFVDYTKALATEDDAAKEEAAEGLAAYAESFGSFLATATDGDEQAFQNALEAHVAQLTSALDAAAAGDLERAWELEREAYAHMFMTGDALVSAIVAQNPDKFPAAEASKTTTTTSATTSATHDHLTDHDSIGA